MTQYQRNNILFRIASADAIGKFKATQAHSFLQLTRKELGFYEAAKEAVLLEYDMMSHWIYKIERMCLVAGTNPDGTHSTTISSDLKSVIAQSFRDELRVIQNVMESHGEVFSKITVQYSKMIHDYSVKLFVKHVLAESEALSSMQFFSNLVSGVSNYLQHLLIAMHELNSNVIDKIDKPFICIADFSIEIAKGDDRFESIDNRIQFFKEQGCGEEFVFKNYSHHDKFEQAKNFLQIKGINLTPEVIEESSIC